jgi:hypothetical protein
MLQLIEDTDVPIATVYMSGGQDFYDCSGGVEASKQVIS